MLKIAVDWAVKKNLAITEDGEKIEEIPATRESFEKYLAKLNPNACFYLEEGGGDVFKLLANKNNFKVFTIAGKKTKEYRESSLGIEKTDENDVKIIYMMANNQAEQFREFGEKDILTSKVSIAFKNRGDAEKNLVRAKNRLFALKNQMDLLNISEKDREKIIKNKEEIIEKLIKDFQFETKALNKLVTKHPVWINYLQYEKGVGTAVAGAIISQIKDASRFDNKYSLRHYAGMIAKKGN